MISVIGVSTMRYGDRPAGQVGEHHLRIDAQEMVHRGDQVARRLRGRSVG